MVWIIIGCLLFALTFWFIRANQLLAPVFSYMGLLALSFANNALGQPYLPINNTILISWLCMTLVVMVATLLQPGPVRQQTRGVWYMAIGSFTGMAIGLLAFTFTLSLPLLYASMVLGTAAGCFFGYLVFTNTPRGAAVNFSSGNFFRYLLAKGFPIAIAIMMMGVVLILLLYINNIN